MRHKETAARTESTFLRPTAATIMALTGSVTHTLANEETVHPQCQKLSGALLMIQPDWEEALVVVLQHTLLLISIKRLQCHSQWNLHTAASVGLLPFQGAEKLIDSRWNNYV